MTDVILGQILVNIEDIKINNKLLNTNIQYSISSTNNYINDVIKYTIETIAINELNIILESDENIKLIYDNSMELIDKNSPYKLLEGFLNIELFILSYENNNLNKGKMDRITKIENKIEKKIKSKERITKNIMDNEKERKERKDKEVEMQKKISDDIEVKKIAAEKLKYVVNGVKFTFLDKNDNFDNGPILICSDNRNITPEIKGIHKKIIENEFKETNIINNNEFPVLLYHDNIFIHVENLGKQNMIYKMYIDTMNINLSRCENMFKKCIDIIYYYYKYNIEFRPKKIRFSLIDINNVNKSDVAKHIISGILLGIDNIMSDKKDENLVKEILPEVEFAFDIDRTFYDAYINNFMGGTMPCIELYEFMLDGYGITDEESSQFNEIIDVKQNECGTIKTMNKSASYKSLFNNFSDEIISCDVIRSEQIGGELLDNELLNINELYKYYLTLNTKTQWDEGPYSLEIKEEIINIIDKAKDINYKLLEIYCEDEIPNYDIMHEGAFIMKMNVNNNDKIILFGDFHGSFHTFFRHMLRLAKFGIINLQNYEITNGYKLIFLGDIIDRGEYGLEIVQFICKMIYVNNNDTAIKIIYVRGNHEVRNQYTERVVNGPRNFIMEIKNKLEIDIPSKLEDDKSVFKYFFSTCPSAIILSNNGNNFWLCHGGIPIDLKEKIILPKLLDMSKLCDIKFYEKTDIHGKDDIPSQIRWNDFYPNPDKSNAYLHANKKIISPENLNIFMLEHEINFIIRGHQDKPLNSYLYSTHEKYTFNNDKSEYLKYRYPICIKKDDYVFDNIFKNVSKNTKNKVKSVQGPIARLLCDTKWIGGIKDNKQYEKIFPVLTISTNTDIDRPLYKDSFVILKFDLHIKRVNIFDKFTNTLDNRKDDIKTMEDLNINLTISYQELIKGKKNNGSSLIPIINTPDKSKKNNGPPLMSTSTSKIPLDLEDL